MDRIEWIHAYLIPRQAKLATHEYAFAFLKKKSFSLTPSSQLVINPMN
jgi:hypothetical protein